MAWEAALLLWTQNTVRHEWLDPVIARFTQLGNAGILWIVITLILLIIPKTRKIGWACFFSLVLSLIFCNGLLKHLVARPRPYTQIPGLQCLVPLATDWSFPSGHSSSAFCVGTVCLARLPKKAGIPLITLAALLALSRLYVGIHYPTDVIGGVLLGIVLALLAMKLFDLIDARVEAWKKRRAEQKATL
ncbi:MAG: phosphatase PAP2 family protein [Lachnospiraceae bacterium]|nr:phosphatase PAP2 family protein [Lachnospiraceae bacterium]